jgi:hypothetical protein
MKRLRQSILGLAWGLLASLIVAAPALSAGGTGAGGGGTSNASGGGDDVETVPIVQGGTGFVLRGSLEDVRFVLRTVQAQGTPQITLASQGDSVQVVYQGHFRLRLDAEMFAEGGLTVNPFGPGISVLHRSGTWFIRG